MLDTLGKFWRPLLGLWMYHILHWSTKEHRLIQNFCILYKHCHELWSRRIISVWLAPRHNRRHVELARSCIDQDPCDVSTLLAGIPIFRHHFQRTIYTLVKSSTSSCIQRSWYEAPPSDQSTKMSIGWSSVFDNDSRTSAAVKQYTWEGFLYLSHVWPLLQLVSSLSVCNIKLHLIQLWLDFWDIFEVSLLRHESHDTTRTTLLLG